MAEIVTASKLFRIVVPAPFITLVNLTSITRCHPLHSTHLVSQIFTHPLIIPLVNPYLATYPPSSSRSNFNQSRMDTSLRRRTGN